MYWLSIRKIGQNDGKNREFDGKNLKNLHLQLNLYEKMIGSIRRLANGGYGVFYSLEKSRLN